MNRHDADSSIDHNTAAFAQYVCVVDECEIVTEVPASELPAPNPECPIHEHEMLLGGWRRVLVPRKIRETVCVGWCDEQDCGCEGDKPPTRAQYEAQRSSAAQDRGHPFVATGNAPGTPSAACICIGGPVVAAGPKVLTWECSRCGKRRRVRREQVGVIHVPA